MGLAAGVSTTPSHAQPRTAASSNPDVWGVGPVGSNRGEPTSTDKETARSLMERGIELYEAKDYNGALKAYLSANSIMHVPSTSVAVAQAYAALGRLVDARDFALEAMRYPEQPQESAAFRKARKEAADLEQRLATRLPTLQIDLRGAPADAAVQVRVDGSLLPPAALGLAIMTNPGSHRVVASASKFLDASVSVDLKEGDKKTITLMLTPASEARGAATAQTPAPSPALVPTSEQRKAEGTSPLVYLGLAVGAAGVISGTVTGLLAFSKTASVQDRCTDNKVCPLEAESDADTAKSIAMASNISFAVGAAGLAVALVGWLTSGNQSATASTHTATSVQVRPILGVGQVAVVGRF